MTWHHVNRANNTILQDRISNAYREHVLDGRTEEMQYLFTPTHYTPLVEQSKDGWGSYHHSQTNKHWFTECNKWSRIQVKPKTNQQSMAAVVDGYGGVSREITPWIGSPWISTLYGWWILKKPDRRSKGREGQSPECNANSGIICGGGICEAFPVASG